ncbi:hypothetical protein G3M48_001238 [Beauveria asiatica]|uniref:Uncharacterized protein n=1 Tax=Beauveria asiatica TaxID=1069075 RepID=A0AAW0RFY5_9HYPO
MEETAFRSHSSTGLYRRDCSSAIDDATTFRMLPERDAHPEFPAILPNGISFIFILMIPYLVWLENLPGRGIFVARAIRPLTRRCSRWGQWAFMLPRIWLMTAIFNHYLLSVLIDRSCVVSASLRISFSVWLL